MGYKRPYHGGNKSAGRALNEHYVKFVAPNLLASFCLVLYDKTNMDVDDIQYLVSQVAPLWNRSIEEGWDIRKNCKELLDIDVMHELEAKERGISG